jgi:hypothetical protein
LDCPRVAEDDKSNARTTAPSRKRALVGPEPVATQFSSGISLHRTDSLELYRSKAVFKAFLWRNLTTLLSTDLYFILEF